MFTAASGGVGGAGGRLSGYTRRRAGARVLVSRVARLGKRQAGAE